MIRVKFISCRVLFSGFYCREGFFTWVVRVGFGRR